MEVFRLKFFHLKHQTSIIRFLDEYYKYESTITPAVCLSIELQPKYCSHYMCQIKKQIDWFISEQNGSEKENSAQ